MAKNRTVNVRLATRKTGDPKAFVEAATDVEALAKAVKKLTADSKKNARAIKLAEKNIRSMSRSAGGINKLNSSFSRLGTTIIAFAGFAALRAGMRFVTNAAQTQAKAIAQLNATLESTEYAAGRSSESLQAHARAMQKVTNFGDEAVIGMQSLLLTFKEIGGGTVNRATEVVLDLATKLKTDLKSAATLVGKALNDPILGLQALTRVGVTFSDDQKEVIRALVETGDVAGAQAVILKELESQVQGSARAAREASNSYEAASNAAGDLGEQVGGPLNVALKNVYESFADAAGGASSMAKDASTLGKVLGSIVTSTKILAGGIKTSFDLMEGYLGGLVIAFASAGIKIAELAAKAADAAGFDEAAAKWRGSLEEFKSFLDGYGETLTGNFEADMRAGQARLGKDWENLADIWTSGAGEMSQATEEMGQRVPAALTGVQEGAETTDKAVAQMVESMVGGIKAATPTVEQEATAIKIAFENMIGDEQKEKVKAALEEVLARFRAAGQDIPPELAKIADEIGVVTTALERPGFDLTPFAEETKTAMSDAGGAVKDMVITMEDLEEAGAGVSEGAEALSEYGEQADGVRTVAEAVSDLAEAQKTLSDAERGAASLSEMAEALRELNDSQDGAGQVAAALNEIASAVDNIAGASALDGLVAKLKEVGDEAEATGAKLRDAFSVSGGGGGAAPSPEG